nr:peptidase S8 subtilase family protein [uncultured bacterium]
MSIRNPLLAACVALTLIAGCGVKAVPTSPRATVAVGKLAAQSLKTRTSIFSNRHLVVRMAPGAQPPLPGTRVRPAGADKQIHVLPRGARFDQALAAYQAAPAVKTIERLELYPKEADVPAAPAVLKAPVPKLPVNDPFYYQQWSHTVGQVGQAWEFSRGRADVIVGVLDTGVDYNHPDLVGRVIDGPDFAEESDTSLDIDSHGTHVAGIIAANADDSTGVAGIAPGVKVLSLKIFEPHFDGDKFLGNYTNDFALARALHYAVTQGGCKVINVSAQIAGDPMVKTMFQLARGQGVVICLSAGNEGNNVYSGSVKEMDGVLTTHATDPQERLASFSNYGSTMAVSAPGKSILSTVPTYPHPHTGQEFGDAGYDALSGTSMASPFVAGVAALVVSALLDRVQAHLSTQFQVEAHLTPRDISGRLVEDLIRSTCIDLGTLGRDEIYGCGRVDAHRAMLACAMPSWLDRAAREYLRNQER